MWTSKGERPRVTLAFVALLSLAAVAAIGPSSPRADEPVTFAPPWEGTLRYSGEFAGFRIAPPPEAARNAELYVGTSMTPSPDLVFISPGGIMQPPSPCIAAGSTSVRCPLANIASLDLSMGDGDDIVETTTVSGPSSSGFRISIDMGLGNDSWYGGPLGERWFGGPGNDRAAGRGGSDKFTGGTGNDRMFGGMGVDFFSGGPGRDLARGGAGDDKGSGGPGADDFKD